jgi:hypothetical protein
MSVLGAAPQSKTPAGVVSGRHAVVSVGRPTDLSTRPRVDLQLSWTIHDPLFYPATSRVAHLVSQRGGLPSFPTPAPRGPAAVPSVAARERGR